MSSVVRPDSGGHPPDEFTRIGAAHPRSSVAACWCDMESWDCPGGVIVVMRVSGELDLCTRPLVAATLAEAGSRAPAHLVVDLAATTFCGVRGFALFAEIAGARGAGFALSGLSAHHSRVADLVLPRPGPVRHRSVAAAVTALCPDRRARTPDP